jgi:Glycosyl hydrolase family 47
MKIALIFILLVLVLCCQAKVTVVKVTEEEKEEKEEKEADYVWRRMKLAAESKLRLGARGTSEILSSLSRAELASSVRSEFLKSWQAYKQYAWGHDELLPLSRSFKDYDGLLWTPVDALSTMLAMNVSHDVVAEATGLICSRLDTRKNQYVGVFDTTLRVLGGLVSAHITLAERSMADADCILQRAVEIGDALHGVFLRASVSGLPGAQVNLKTGVVGGAQSSSPAAAGTSIVEMGTLSRLTGDSRYFDAAKQALMRIFAMRSAATGLVADCVNLWAPPCNASAGAPPCNVAERFCSTVSHVNGNIDSFVEYLFKCALLFGDADCERMWRQYHDSVQRWLAYDQMVVGRGGRPERWHKRVNYVSGANATDSPFVADQYSAFYAGVLALANDTDAARLSQSANTRLWFTDDAFVEPHRFDFRLPGRIVNGRYSLNPETFESNYYLHELTGDVLYLQLALEFYYTFRAACGCQYFCVGYAALSDVKSLAKRDYSPSWLYAETFTYLYLTFAEAPPVNPSTHVFSTEAHPMPKRSPLYQILI